MSPEFSIKSPEFKIQESDSVILFLSELAAGSRNIASVSDRAHRSHEIEGAGAWRDVAVPSGNVERRAAIDPLRLEG